MAHEFYPAHAPQPEDASAGGPPGVWDIDVWTPLQRACDLVHVTVPLIGPRTGISSPTPRLAVWMVVSKPLAPWLRLLAAQPFPYPGAHLPGAPVLPPGALYVLGVALQQAAAGAPPSAPPPTLVAAGDLAEHQVQGPGGALLLHVNRGVRVGELARGWPHPR